MSIVALPFFLLFFLSIIQLGLGYGPLQQPAITYTMPPPNPELRRQVISIYKGARNCDSPACHPLLERFLKARGLTRTLFA